jgi:methanogenic corrinoid protein MtbC1
MGAEQQVEEDIGEDLNAITPIITPPTQIELLLKTVETELIPRLFVSHMMDVPVTSPLVESRKTEPTPGPWCGQKDIEAFAELCISNDPQKLDQHVTDLLARGVTLESIFLYLLAPVARHLGDRWTDDELSFVDVHLGLCRLHQLICECEAIGYRSENMPLLDQSILLTSAPGENHTFGVTMVADFFRRYGWQVSNLCGLDTDFLLARLSSTYYNAVGFSLHNDYNYEGLEDIISRVRSAATNKDLVIMVGGDYFMRNPEMVNSVGADIFASDGHQAVLLASNASKRGGVEV